MTTDDFEKRLQRQPLRPIPAEWRGEILRAAREAARSCPAGHTLEPAPAWRSLVSAFNTRLSGLLWPCPQAWAGLAALWLAILSFNIITREPSRLAAVPASAPSGQFAVALVEQQRLLAELLGPSMEPHGTVEAPLADRPKTIPPRPRSEGRNTFSLA